MFDTVLHLEEGSLSPQPIAVFTRVRSKATSPPLESERQQVTRPHGGGHPPPPSPLPPHPPPPTNGSDTQNGSNSVLLHQVARLTPEGLRQLSDDHEEVSFPRKALRTLNQKSFLEDFVNFWR